MSMFGGSVLVVFVGISLIFIFVVMSVSIVVNLLNFCVMLSVVFVWFSVSSMLL